MEIICKHHKTLFERDDFIIGVYLVIEEKGKAFVTCKGYGLPKTNSCFYKFTGEYVDDKGRKVFAVDSSQIAITKSKAGVKSFFKNDEFLGLDANTIDNIVEKFGYDVFKTIKYKPNLLLKVKGMNDKKLDIVVKGYNKVTSLSELTKLLSPMGITPRTIKLINSELGERASYEIERDPFSLIKIKGIGFRTCDTIARYTNKALDSKTRIECGVVESLREMSSSGDTYVIDKQLIEYSLSKLNSGLDKPVVNEQNVVSVIFDMMQNKKIYCENNNQLFLDKYHEAEELIAKTIVKNYANREISEKEKLCNTAEEYKDVKLSARQMFAVKNALSNSFSVITGSAGTGKTSVTNAIIYAYKKVYPNREITLLAPTGKASRRISQVTKLPAYTIHARLGLYEDVDEPNQFINGGLIIVDEFSMVDVLLFSNLLKATTGNAHIVLIGDINQLQSVGAGACLKDLIDSGTIPVSRLTEIFRQEGGNIVDNSIKVIENNTNLKYGDDFMFVPVNNEDSAISEIKKIYKYYIGKVGIENVAILTPLRNSQDRFKAVSDELNALIQNEINNSSVSYEFDGKVFKLHDRVMMWKNTEIASNGDIGTIVSLDTHNSDWGMEMKVKWENGNTGVYHKNNLSDITLAYAMTVHKSQGSEYEVVIMPVLSDHKCRMFKNNLFYTGITRAKKTLVLVGDEKATNYMISHSETNSRKTILRQMLLKYGSTK